MSKQRISIALLAISLLSISWIAPAQAHLQGGGWSEPYRLSSDAGKSSEAYLTADQYGYVHCFWTETLFDNGNWLIKYARFDGTTWSKPNDIYVTNTGMRNVSPFVDQQGILHIAWAEGLIGPAYYTYAPANDAFSAKSWAKPIQINVPARVVALRVDSKGVIHMLYINQIEGSAGVYYIRSEDSGKTWSEPLWLDPDILPGHIPDSLSFELDENDGLHAVWMYGTREADARPDWVRYTHSFDGGHTWSAPILIDQYDEASGHYLTTAGPVMILQGQTVHVIWAAGSLPYRYHRFSTDAGLTWSAPVRIFGNLHGQAFDGLAVDRAGRVHFFGQIRYPVAIYHAYWDQGRWSNPSMVYLVDEGSGIGNRIHAHHTLPVIRAGNQIVLTFADGPADPHRRLFVTYRTLDDILPIESMPTPDSTATSVPMSSPTPRQPTPIPTRTATAPSLESLEAQPLGSVPAPDHAIRVALIPTLLVLGATIFIQWLYRRKE